MRGMWWEREEKSAGKKVVLLIPPRILKKDYFWIVHERYWVAGCVYIKRRGINM